MAKRIAVANQKGGVGKTTEIRGLAFFGNENKLRVLVVDFDPQRNSSMTFLRLRKQAILRGEIIDQGEHETALKTSQLFIEGNTAQPLFCGGNIWLIEGDKKLVDVAAKPLEEIMLPRQELDRFDNDFDLMVFDTAPTLGMPLYAALIAATAVVCPCDMDDDSLEGVKDLFGNIMNVRNRGWNVDLKLIGILPTKVDSRRAYDKNALVKLRSRLGDMVTKSVLWYRNAAKVAKDTPVWKDHSGESARMAGKEMRTACIEIFEKAGVKLTKKGGKK